MYFELLSESDLTLIHESTLHVMGRVGLDIHSGSARDLLARAGAKVDGIRVFFPPELVQSAIDTVPESFYLHARNPDNNLMIGGNHSLFLPANCAAYVYDMDIGRRYGTFEDFENFVKLTGGSPYLDMVSSVPVEPSDIPPGQRNVRMLYSIIKNTDKCFMGGSTGGKAASESLEMAAILHGIEKTGLPEKARVLGIPCSLTPLAYDEAMAACLMTYAEAGQPVIVNSLGVSGATSPGTLAGTLVVENSEILAGIVLSQLVREGTPVVYGGASTIANMRTGAICVGAPEMALSNAMTAQMARFYGIPSRGCGALTESHRPGNQSAYESMMNLTAAVTSGLNIILHAAGALSSINCMSYEKFVIDEEMCGMARRIKIGVTVSPVTIGVDTIEHVGPGGHFLNTTHTFQHFRKEFFMPEIADRQSFMEKPAGDPDTMLLNARQKWQNMLSEYTAPELPPEIEKDLDRYLKKIG